MPTSYSIDKARHLVRSRFWGVLTNQAVRDHGRRLATDPAFDPAFYQLCDLRDLIVAAVSDDAVADVARKSVFRRGVRRAFVIDEEQYLRSGLARLFQEYAEQAPGQQIKVFHDLAEAERWVEFGG